MQPISETADIITPRQPEPMDKASECHIRRLQLPLSQTKVAAEIQDKPTILKETINPTKMLIGSTRTTQRETEPTEIKVIQRTSRSTLKSNQRELLEAVVLVSSILFFAKIQLNFNSDQKFLVV